MRFRTILAAAAAPAVLAVTLSGVISAPLAGAATLPTHEARWAGYYATAGAQPIYVAVATVTIPATPPATASSACPRCGPTAVPTGSASAA